jgi:Zn-dependent protease
MLGLPDVTTLVAYAIVLMTAFSVHEFAHAWTANYFGDDTPRLNGRLTLNPLAHLDLIGSLMLFVAGFGWAKPVPVSLYALERRSPSAPMWVALAGPLSNFMMAVLAAIPFRLGLIKVQYFSGSFHYFSQYLPEFIVQILFIFLITNLLLMIFNLLPIYPLDGEKVASYAFPPYMERGLNIIRPYGPMILLVLILMGSFAGLNVLGALMNPPQLALMRALLGV